MSDPQVCVLCGVESWRILGPVCSGCEYDRHASAWLLAEARWHAGETRRWLGLDDELIIWPFPWETP